MTSSGSPATTSQIDDLLVYLARNQYAVVAKTQFATMDLPSLVYAEARIQGMLGKITEAKAAVLEKDGQSKADEMADIATAANPTPVHLVVEADEAVNEPAEQMVPDAADGSIDDQVTVRRTMTTVEVRGTLDQVRRLGLAD